MSKLQPGTYPAYFDKYIQLVETDSVTEAINKYAQPLIKFFESIPKDKAGHRYAEGKWSVKEMLQHIIDTERIFGYRALSIARKDKTPLPGFDEKNYSDASKADERSWVGLIEELKAVRASTDLLLKSFNEEQLQQTGITNGQPNTVDAIAFIIFGHLLHHKKILEERYF